MDHDRRKAMRIVTEVMGYFVEHNAQKLQVELDVSKGIIVVMVSGCLPLKPYDLDTFISAMDEPRQPEMDEYYDGLLGFDSKLQGYHLLGAIIDKAEITYEDGCLSVRIERRQ